MIAETPYLTGVPAFYFTTWCGGIILTKSLRYDKATEWMPLQ
jgi:hypothetical protein